MNFFNYMEAGVFFFFTAFFGTYAGRYGLKDSILIGGTTHEILFNLGVWFVLMMICMDGFVKSLKRDYSGNKSKTGVKGK